MHSFRERKVKLGTLPTPFERLSHLELQTGHRNLWIKRDDLTGLALGGNKVRKLEYLAYEALQQEASVLLTFGGMQTNHGRLTVAAARRLGLTPVLILDGERPEKWSGNLVLDLLMGADIRFRAEMNALAMANEVIAEYEALGQNVFVIPLGGSNATGVLGYVDMMLELDTQIKKAGLAPRRVYLPVGSCGMLAGVLLGAKLIGLDATMFAIPVASASVTDLKDQTIALCEQTNARYNLGVSPIKDSDFSIEIGHPERPYFGAGYNRPDQDTVDAIERFAHHEGIILDPCYSGKAARAFLDAARETSAKDDPILFIHSGGVPAVWTDTHLTAMQDRLDDLFHSGRAMDY